MPPAPNRTATAAGIAELVLPILLILGFATRFASLGLLLITAIDPPFRMGWANFHLRSAAMALALVVFGGGRTALDPLIMHRRK
jgi:putative oxidoreductase